MPLLFSIEERNVRVEMSHSERTFISIIGLRIYSASLEAATAAAVLLVLEMSDSKMAEGMKKQLLDPCFHIG